MARARWTVVCERAVVDRESNNVSLINQIEQAQVTILSASPAPELPVGLPHTIVHFSARSERSVGEQVEARIGGNVQIVRVAGGPVAGIENATAHGETTFFGAKIVGCPEARFISRHTLELVADE